MMNKVESNQKTLLKKLLKALSNDELCSIINSNKYTTPTQKNAAAILRERGHYG